jgi:hypothetical protein
MQSTLRANTKKLDQCAHYAEMQPKVGDMVLWCAYRNPRLKTLGIN